MEYNSLHIKLLRPKPQHKNKTHSDSILLIRNHTLSRTILCVISKVNFIKQLLKGGKTNKVFVACGQVIPALYNPATEDICIDAGLWDK